MSESKIVLHGQTGKNAYADTKLSIMMITALRSRFVEALKAKLTEGGNS